MKLITFNTIKTITLLILLLSPAIYAQKQQEAIVEIGSSSIEKVGNEVTISIEMDFTDRAMKSNERYVFTPRLINGANSTSFPKIEIAGRRQRIYRERFHQKEDDIYHSRLTYKKGESQQLSYKLTVPYEKWMEGAALEIREDECGCSDKILHSGLRNLLKVKFTPDPFKVHLSYIHPDASPKLVDFHGSAYLIFKVNNTVVDPALANNARELAAIHEQAYKISSEEFVTLKEIRLHGYASPEGGYNNNARLAQLRVDAVKKYLEQHYGYSSTFIKTSSTPENWSGLREKVAESALVNKSGIISIIDKTMDADQKESEIRSAYPQDYAYMLKEFYPALRRTDYTIHYVIRSFSVEEAKELIKTTPALLSLNEMYLVANEYAPGSEQFNEVFEIAVKLFPGDEVANLNAANIALLKGDLPLAAKQLAKAGDTPRAINSRGVLAMLEENLPLAADLLKQAADAGIAEAGENLKQVMMRLENE